MGGFLKLVLVSHDDQLLALLNDAVKLLSIEVLPLADLYLPEPPVSDSDPYIGSTTQATVISEAVDLPAIGHARSFVIDPLMRYGGGDSDPQWRWPLPWSGTKENLAAELIEADDVLNRGGYCGPDDRGAFFHTVLCLAWPDAETQIFEGRMDGQFAPIAMHLMKSEDVTLDFVECFVPDDETATITKLDGGYRQWDVDMKQAVGALRHALEVSSSSPSK